MSVDTTSCYKHHLPLSSLSGHHLSDPRQDTRCFIALGLSSPVVMSVLPPNRDQQGFAYEISDQPRHLTADDLSFLAKYTGKSAEVLRPHVYSVWRSTKEQVPALSRSCHESAVCVTVQRDRPVPKSLRARSSDTFRVACAVLRFQMRPRHHVSGPQNFLSPPL